MSIEVASKGEGRILYIVIGLLLLHLTLISIQVEDPSGTLLFKRWVMAVGGPILNASSAVSRSAGKLWSGYIWLHGARSENERLREDVRQLELINSRLVQQEDENARLKRLLDFRQTLPFQTIGAHVVGRAPNFLSNTLYLDRGSRDGIRVNQPVLADGGVVGRTVLVTRSSSQVQLLTNADASVGVILERSRLQGVLSGTENMLLDLKYISNTSDAEDGDVLVTSGLDGIYPPGLPVGKVVESNKGRTGFRILKVAPAADMIRIEEVLVLTGPSKTTADMPDSIRN